MELGQNVYLSKINAKYETGLDLGSLKILEKPCIHFEPIFIKLGQVGHKTWSQKNLLYPLDIPIFKMLISQQNINQFGN